MLGNERPCFFSCLESKVAVKNLDRAIKGPKVYPFSILQQKNVMVDFAGSQCLLGIFLQLLLKPLFGVARAVPQKLSRARSVGKRLATAVWTE